MQWPVLGVKKDGHTSIHLRNFTFAVGYWFFFGLGTGYFIWGGQALFGFPKTSPEMNAINQSRARLDLVVSRSQESFTSEFEYARRPHEKKIFAHT